MLSNIPLSLLLVFVLFLINAADKKRLSCPSRQVRVEFISVRLVGDAYLHEQHNNEELLSLQSYQHLLTSVFVPLAPVSVSIKRWNSVVYGPERTLCSTFVQRVRFSLYILLL